MRAVALLVVVAALVGGIAGGVVVAVVGDRAGDESQTDVPYVVGLNEQLAIQVVEEAGMRVEVRRLESRGMRVGTVVAQSPAEGTSLDHDAAVLITVARKID